jgi:hypothetical protein
MSERNHIYSLGHPINGLSNNKGFYLRSKIMKPNKLQKVLSLDIVVAALFAMALLSGCQEASQLPNNSVAEMGTLQLAFISPADVDQINVAVHEGEFSTDNPLRTDSLSTGVVETLFSGLTVGTYFVTGEGLSADGTVLYEGGAQIVLVRDQMNSMQIALIQSNPIASEGNAPPTINAVSVVGRGADRNDGSNLLMIVPETNEEVTFTAITSDPNGDTVSIHWSVTDTADGEGGNDVGAITGSPTDASITWSHNIEGDYYVHLRIEDGEGGSAAFSFSIKVFNGTDDLMASFSFNSFPTIEIGVDSDTSGDSGIDGTRFVFNAIATDPDGDDILSYKWTSSCVNAPIDGDDTLPELVLNPTESETCSVSVEVADENGHNSASMQISIECVPLSIEGDEGGPANTCALIE